MPTFTKIEFVQQIRLALNNLHDFAFLQKLPLVSRLAGSERSLDQAVRYLRSEILDAIEQLNPSGSMPERAKERRPYMLLFGRYVQGMTTAELVDELAISIRQLRREQARALNAVTELLWDRLSGQISVSSEDVVINPSIFNQNFQHAVESEAGQLLSQANIDDLALANLVDGVLSTLSPVAQSRGIRILVELPESLPLIRANRVVLRQALMGLLFFALQRLSEGKIAVSALAPGGVILRVIANGKFQVAETGNVNLDVSRKLFSSFGAGINISESPGSWQAEVTLPVAEDIPVLIMDDNAGLIELFQRYLAGRGYRVIVAHSLVEVNETASKYELKLIILDVMMPDQDGWEILQRLKTAPQTSSIPVMICSVLNEPEIAYTLGASDYLPKPVTQNDLLAKVERWCRTSRPVVP